MKKLTVDQVKEKLNVLYDGKVTVDESTYVNTSTKARFTHIEFGEWIAKSNDVLGGHLNTKAGTARRKNSCLEKYGVSHVSKDFAIKEKKRQTTFKNYGVDNPQQNKEISLRTAKSSNDMRIKFHWRTNEELVCRGSWESAVVDYLNINKIDFEWQSKTFMMPSGKTYRPDFFLVTDGKWVEIKGYFRDDAKEKWDWFQSIMPNSELWDKNKMKEMNLLSSNSMGKNY